MMDIYFKKKPAIVAAAIEGVTTGVCFAAIMYTILAFAGIQEAVMCEDVRKFQPHLMDNPVFSKHCDKEGGQP